MYDLIKEKYSEAFIMNGYDDCIIGVCHRSGQETIVAYSYEKVIAKLMADGMTHEEAVEFFELNQLNMWMGKHTPCFIERPME